MNLILFLAVLLPTQYIRSVMLHNNLTVASGITKSISVSSGEDDYNNAYWSLTGTVSPNQSTEYFYRFFNGVSVPEVLTNSLWYGWLPLSHYEESSGTISTTVTFESYSLHQAYHHNMRGAQFMIRFKDGDGNLSSYIYSERIPKYVHPVSPVGPIPVGCVASLVCNLSASGGATIHLTEFKITCKNADNCLSADDDKVQYRVEICSGNPQIEASWQSASGAAWITLDYTGEMGNVVSAVDYTIVLNEEDAPVECGSTFIDYWGTNTVYVSINARTYCIHTAGTGGCVDAYCHRLTKRTIVGTLNVPAE